jgi:predicted patatin/cPLA2 family phospholipase
MMEKLHSLRAKLVKVSGMKAGGAGGGGASGGVSDALMKKRLEEETKKIRLEVSEKTKKMLEQEKQIKKLAGEYKKVQEEVVAKHSDHMRALMDLKDLEASRDMAMSQVYTRQHTAYRCIQSTHHTVYKAHFIQYTACDVSGIEYTARCMR